MAPYPDEFCEGVVDVRSSGHKETTAGAQIMEEEQLLILEKEARLLSLPGGKTTLLPQHTQRYYSITSHNRVQ